MRAASILTPLWMFRVLNSLKDTKCQELLSVLTKHEHLNITWTWVVWYTLPDTAVIWLLRLPACLETFSGFFLAWRPACLLQWVLQLTEWVGCVCGWQQGCTLCFAIYSFSPFYRYSGETWLEVGPSSFTGWVTHRFVSPFWTPAPYAGSMEQQGEC